MGRDLLSPAERVLSAEEKGKADVDNAQMRTMIEDLAGCQRAR